MIVFRQQMSRIEHINVEIATAALAIADAITTRSYIAYKGSSISLHDVSRAGLLTSFPEIAPMAAA